MVSAAAEALTLGFASGPVCIASCGPVLLPSLAAQAEGWRGTARSLTVFLTGRLAGYLAFAILAFAAGAVIPSQPASRAAFSGWANLVLALALATYAWAPFHLCARTAVPEPVLVNIGRPARSRRAATLTLGFLTGLNLCPPFAAAGLRAAELRSLAGALAFFLLFFLGTAVWFVPALAVSPLRRVPSAATVARFTMAALSLCYAYLAIVTLSWRYLHG
jgi:sulfite exporter TauE/SafE